MKYFLMLVKDTGGIHPAFGNENVRNKLNSGGLVFVEKEITEERYTSVAKELTHPELTGPPTFDTAAETVKDK